MPAEEALELSVVIPCLNEETTVAACVSEAIRAMTSHGIAGEVVVSDNGSSDASATVAAAAGARVVHCPRRGYGAALELGFRVARGRYVIMGDADGSYDFSELPRFVERLRSGEPFVMGTRLRGSIAPGAMPASHRRLGTPVLTWILNLLFGTRISDCNCGLRGFRRAEIEALALSSTGMEFASEMIIQAAIRGLPISEVPVTLRSDRRGGRPPHLRPWRDGWRHLRLLLWHAPDHTMTWPGLLLALLGMALMGSQLAGPFRIGSALFDIHYMVLGLTLAMLGVSALSMGTAVHALMPEDRLRAVRPFRRLKAWFTFERAALIAATAFALGIACDGYVLVHWLATDRGPLGPGHTRLTLVGLFFLAVSFQTLLLGFLVGSAATALSPAAEPPPPAPSPEGRAPDA